MKLISLSNPAILTLWLSVVCVVAYQAPHFIKSNAVIRLKRSDVSVQRHRRQAQPLTQKQKSQIVEHHNLLRAIEGADNMELMVMFLRLRLPNLYDGRGYDIWLICDGMKIVLFAVFFLWPVALRHLVNWIYCRCFANYHNHRKVFLCSTFQIVSLQHIQHIIVNTLLLLSFNIPASVSM